MKLQYKSHEQLIIDICKRLERTDMIEDLTNELLVKTFMKTKPMKDPNLPKRAISAYTAFCQENRDKIKASHPDFKLAEMSKELAKQWGELKPEDKHHYEKISENDKDRYQNEMIQYNTT